MSTCTTALLSVLFVFVAAIARAENFPEKPITLVCGFAAGAAADAHLRALARAMSRVLRQSVVVENRPGVSGTLAASFVANAKPDGYTLVQVTNAVIRQPFISPTNYDPVRASLT